MFSTPEALLEAGYQFFGKPHSHLYADGKVHRYHRDSPQSCGWSPVASKKLCHHKQLPMYWSKIITILTNVQTHIKKNFKVTPTERLVPFSGSFR
jgi:hypothetical protein